MRRIRSRAHVTALVAPLALGVLAAAACGGQDVASRIVTAPPVLRASPTASSASAADGGAAIPALSATTVLVEAEELRATGAWRARPFGTNYYAATLADTFLSRKAYLGAPEQCVASVASATVTIPSAGRYLALARYEAPPRFSAEFRVVVEQGGKTKLDRLYGARANVKVWPLGQGLADERIPPWGSSESIVWEGHDTFVELDAGTATLSVIAGPQPVPAARRNVDVVMLTRDTAEVQRRLDKEAYLPLDGLLTQAGDVYLALENRGKEPITLTVPPGTEHSPYWIHLRDWKPRQLVVGPGERSAWLEVGSLLDALYDGQWKLTAASKGPMLYDLDVGVPVHAHGFGQPAPAVERIGHFADRTTDTTLAYAADTRASRRIGLADDALHDLVAHLRARPVRGKAPTRTPVFGMTFDPHPDDARYEAASRDFVKLMGAPNMERGGLGTGLIDVRHVPTDKLEGYLRNLADGKAADLRVVSLGDEIALPSPAAADHAAFRAWLRTQVDPAHLDPAIGTSFGALRYSPDAATAKEHPGLFYWSRVYAYRFGTRALRPRTELVRRVFPGVAVGANFSPHLGAMYLGSTHQFISLFRDGGMTLPWGEDYVFQVPVGSPQVNQLMLDMFRAAVRGARDKRILYYVMPHVPGTTPRAWRRQFYADLAHGATMLDLFEIRPVAAAYTENHVDAAEMYDAVREALHELGTFEDLVQEGDVRAGSAALWFSEAADVWDDHRAPFGANLRALYLAVRQAQVPLDVVVEGDALAPYQALYLTDAHVSLRASRAIAAWVQQGGQLVATAGAGMYDELDRPNTVLRSLLGVQESALDVDPAPVVLEKQDLPFARVMDTVHLAGGVTVPAVSALSRFKADPAIVVGRFDDGAPAVTTRAVGRGTVRYLGFLPGLAYLRPAIPMRPMDRVSDDLAMCHLMPTAVDVAAADLLRIDGVKRPVVVGSPFVESTVLVSKKGALVPLVNWTHAPLRDVTVRLADVRCATCPGGAWRDISLASGKPVRAQETAEGTVLTLDLDVADALVLR